MLNNKVPKYRKEFIWKPVETYYKRKKEFDYKALY